MSEMGARIAGLSPAKRALLAQGLKAKASPGAIAAPIPRTKGRSWFPLSSAQERMWFDHQWNPDLPLYNDAIRLKLSGELHVDLLRQSHENVLRRHDAWRTRFESDRGKMRQIVCAEASCEIPFYDLRALAEADCIRLTEQHAREVTCARFHLESSALHRLRLLRTGEREHVLLCAAHHIVFDGGAAGVYFRELFAGYEMLLRGEAIQLPGLPIQYGDYALWQRTRLDSPELRDQLAYWENALAGIPPVLRFPTDRPRPSVRSGQGACAPLELAPELTAAVRELARRENSTLYSVLLAGFASLLHRYTGDSCLVIGTPVNHRDRRELEPLLGIFVNSLALRLSLDGDPSFGALAQQARDVISEALQYKELPFERLIEALQPERDLSRTPIFQVFFDLQKIPKVADEVAGLRIEMARLRTGTAKFDLNFSMTDMGTSIEGVLEFDTDLFEPETIGRLVEQYKALLESAAQNAGLRVSELPLDRPLASAVSRAHEEEPKSAPGCFMSAAAAVSRAREEEPTCAPGCFTSAAAAVSWAREEEQVSVIDLFYRRAATAPDAVAVAVGGGVASYAELLRDAARLADCLSRKYGERSVPFQLAMEPSYERVAAELAVFQANGFCVAAQEPPSETRTLTREAVREMLQCANGTIEASGLSRKPLDVDGAHTLTGHDDLEASGFSRRALDSVAWSVEVREGTTAVSHAALARQAAAHAEWFRPTDRIALWRDDGFATAAREIWPALIAGACLEVTEPAAIVNSGRITVAHLPAALAGQLVRGADFSRSAVRLLLLDPGRIYWKAPVPLPLDLAWAWCSPLAGGVAVSGAVDPKQFAAGRCVMGSAHGSAEVWLRRDGRPAEIGIAGDLQIGGRATGDRGRVLESSRIEWLPARDEAQAVEIEAALRQQRGVRAAFVAAGLTAYVELEHGGILPELQRNVEHWPSYSRPAALVTVDALPLSPLGEIDLRRLPERNAESAAPKPQAAAPRSALERQIAEIWREELQIDHFGIHDNFFELGGHSMLAARVNALISARLSVELPIRALFENATIAAMAEHIEAVRWALEYLETVPAGGPADRGRAVKPLKRLLEELREMEIHLWVENGKLNYQAPKQGGLPSAVRAELSARKRELIEVLSAAGAAGSPRLSIPRRRDGQLQLSYAQEGLWLQAQLDHPAAFNIPFVIDWTGALDIPVLERCLTEITRRHEVLRQSFAVERGEVRARIAPLCAVHVAVVDLSGISEASRAGQLPAILDQEAAQPFDLARGPLLRAAAIRLNGGPEERHRLLLTVHHEVFDGASAGILMDELAALYDAFRQGTPSPFDELPVQYADYAAWQRERMQGALLERELKYWRRTLAGAPPWVELPGRLSANEGHGGCGEVVYFEVGKAVTGRLKALAAQSRATPFHAMLASLFALTAGYTGQHDTVIGTSVNNRTVAETQSLIGFFVNSLPIRARLSGQVTFRKLLEHVRSVVLEAFEHQEAPFEKLVQELRPERKAGQHPIFQTLFVWQLPADAPRILSGGERIALAMDRGASRCDLTLSAAETGDGLKGWWACRDGMFAAGTINRLARRFSWWLEAAGANPDSPLVQLAAAEDVVLPALAAHSHTDAPFPLSFHQERIWFIDEFETGNVYEGHPTYHNIPLLLRFEGGIDAGLLEASLTEIVQRHAVLRTVVQRDTDTPLQAVMPPAGLRLRTIGPVPADTLLEEAMRVAQEPIPLHMAPLLRATLIRSEGAASLLVAAIHHFAADRATVKLLARELAEIYSALQFGLPCGLPPLADYRDYIRWQRDLPESAAEAMLAYWKLKLGGGPRALELPSSRPRPPVHTYTAARAPLDFGMELLDAVDSIAAAGLWSREVVLLAAFQAVLARYARQEEVAIGVSLACRDMPHTHRMAGPLANLVCLRGELNGSVRARDLLDGTATALAEASSCGGLPFDLLVTELRLKNDMSRTALFDVLFHLDTDPPPSLSFAGTPAEWIDGNLGYGKYDLNLYLRAARSGFGGTLTYNADLYDPRLVRQLMGHFAGLVQAMAADPDALLSEIELLNAAELDRQLREWNPPLTASFENVTIDELFERQAASTPGKTALIFEDAAMDYATLDGRANRLAHRLAKLGVGRDDLVAVCLDRSLEMVVALLGVLKAGGAYLPVDPAYPEERVRFLLSDSGARFLVTRRQIANPALASVPLRIDLDEDAAEAIDPAPPVRRSSPDALAYCIYTSGSTGHPKGVLTEHRNVVRLLMENRGVFDFGPSSVWTMFHSYCFDFSVWEMYGSLLFGGTLVMVPGETARDPKRFLALLRRHSVTDLSQTPGAFYAVADEMTRTGVGAPSLRTVYFGGEALAPVRLRAFRQRYPDVRLVNLYGITETTVHVTYKEICDEEIAGNSASIGRPLPTATAYLMDEHRRLVPPGVCGEIWVGGAGVARGYLNRDELTRSRFCSNPYVTGERIYRSGDLARQSPEGEMLYLGRIDSQVQVRGFRVELDEIENCLLRHPAVLDAAVVAGQTEGSTRLLAYVTPQPNAACAAIRRFLRHEKEGLLEGRRLHELPDGRTVVHNSRNETDFLYREIFEERSYTRHGIVIPDGACVFDVGANIGMFTLFAAQQASDVRVFAFEPIPATFELLRLNAGLHGAGARLFDCGLSDQAGEAEFTWYPHVSIFSGRFADSARERQIVNAFLATPEMRAAAGGAAVAEIEETVRERMRGTPVQCRLRTLSGIIREEGIERIDLLKIDVERSELGVLAGIAEADWNRILQIAMEIHEVDGELETIRRLLEERGFAVTVEQEAWFRGASNFNLYARRPGIQMAPGRPVDEGGKNAWRSCRQLTADLREHLRARLPDYMVPSQIAVLENLPLTANGKIDRARLPRDAETDRASVFDPPRTREEIEIAAIWARVLGVAKVGRTGNFFELGGHSLLATQVISRLRDAFSVEIPIRRLFEAPTVAELAEAVVQAQAAAPVVTPLLEPLARERFRLKHAVSSS